MRYLLPIISLVLFNEGLFSQTDNRKADLSASADLVSRYIWRGSDLSGMPCFQPAVNLEYGHFYAGFWGSAPLAGAAEADFLAGYSSEYFGVSVIDYFVANSDSAGSHKYFEWGKELTGHDLSAEITFPGTEKIPFRVLVAANFYGADSDNSRYYEGAWMFEKDDFSGEVFMGGTDASGWYGNGAGVVNTGVSLTKEIKISEHFSLPVFTKIIVNPQKENVYFVFGLTFR
jgi:hypothetical protein